MSNFANPQEDSNILRAVLASGSAALPSIVFANDLTHGLYWTTNGLTLSGLATPMNAGDAANKAYVDGNVPSASFPLLAPNGTAGAPSYAFSGHPTTGIYGTGSDSLLIAIAGQLLADFNNGGLSILGTGTQIIAVDGTSGAPSYTFSSNSAAGFFYDSGNSTVACNTNLAIPAGNKLTVGALDDTDFALGYDGSTAFTLVLGGGNTTLSVDHTTGAVSVGPNIGSASFDGNSTATETRMLLWDIDKGALSRVSVGAADSGGTGFKLLRVPN